VPLFSIQVSQGKFSNAEIQTVFENGEAARQGAIAICSDLGREIFAGLKCGSDWQMHVTDESGKAIFQIKLYSWVLE
jgi:tartrate dehydratase alpha subunit/fumarate hydratase class I-like protein